MNWYIKHIAGDEIKPVDPVEGVSFSKWFNENRKKQQQKKAPPKTPVQEPAKEPGKGENIDVQASSLPSFNSLKEARDYLQSKHNGHGRVERPNGEMIHQCRCGGGETVIALTSN